MHKRQRFTVWVLSAATPLPVNRRSIPCRRGGRGTRAPAWRTARKLAVPTARIAGSRPGINLDTARRCVPRANICQYAGRGRAPDRTRTPDKRSSVVARIADLAEHSRTRPVPELGNRGTGPGNGPVGGQGLEEALGTAIAARVREFRLQLGWTVGQLAAQSGLSKGMLS